MSKVWVGSADPQCGVKSIGCPARLVKSAGRPGQCGVKSIDVLGSAGLGLLDVLGSAGLGLLDVLGSASVRVHQSTCSSKYVFINVRVHQSTCSSVYVFVTVRIHQSTCSSVYVFINVRVHQRDLTHGDTQEIPRRYPRDTQEIPRRYPRDTQEIPRRYPRDTQRYPGDTEEIPKRYLQRYRGDTEVILRDTQEIPRRYRGDTQPVPSPPFPSPRDLLSTVNSCLATTANICPQEVVTYGTWPDLNKQILVLFIHILPVDCSVLLSSVDCSIILSSFDCSVLQLSVYCSTVAERKHFLLIVWATCASNTPMIPLGLKETTPIDFSVPFKDVILEHYSEDGEKYVQEIKDLYELREAVRTPERSHAGVELLMEYFNQLSYIDKRFFSGKRNLPIFFHWYDCLTGVPDTQKSIGFEKGSILYNIGALLTQIACKQDRTTKEGLVQAIVNFEKAAGAFKYLENRFSAAPSQDMRPETLMMLESLMLAQAQECVLESRLIGGSKDGVFNCAQVAQEASKVSSKYKETHTKMLTESLKSYLPFSWLSMAETKYHFYKGLAHYYVALALLDQKDSADMAKLKLMFEDIHQGVAPRDENNGLKLPATEEERNNLGRAHLRESIINHEEAIRIHDLCKQLQKIDTFRDILQKTHERAVNKFTVLEEEDDFSELLTIPEIVGMSEHTTVSVMPDFSKNKVVDIFKRLGHISIFNAANDWSAPRTVTLERQPNEGFGFSVRGDSPVTIADIEEGSVAEKSGMKVKDYIVGIGSVDTKWSKHDEVVKLVRQANLSLTVTLITPVSKSEPNTQRPFSTISLPTTPMKAHQTNHNTSSERERKTQNRISAPWMFVRRNSSKDKTAERPVSVALPIINGNAKVMSNGTHKTLANVDSLTVSKAVNIVGSISDIRKAARSECQSQRAASAVSPRDQPVLSVSPRDQPVLGVSPRDQPVLDENVLEKLIYLLKRCRVSKMKQFT
ncbi:Rhophilin-2 [Bulinus truncatus]|nr:Rhophilin-2 [Bulinus truncatus]